MRVAAIVLTGLAALLLAPRAVLAGPCVRTEFQTQLVEAACKQGGQEAAKTAMKEFSRAHDLTCNACHRSLGPRYPLKDDGLAQFTKLGGKLRAAAAPPPRARPPAPLPTSPAPRPGPVASPPAAPPAVATVPTAATPPIAPAPGDVRLVFERYALANGLEVILAPDASLPVVHVNVWYHVGSGHETYGRSGFAHLFEHMMFQGSKHVGEDRHFSLLRAIGESGVNGTTSFDRTNYFETVPAHQLETALWLESDRMGYLLEPPMGRDGRPVDFAVSLANQIEVVRNERRQRFENAPYAKALLAQFEGLYPEGHPYRYLPIGKHEDLARASVADVQGFFRTWYVPANATLTVSGDFEVGATKALIEKWFSGFPRSTKPIAVAVPAPRVAARELTVADPLAPLRQVRFGWHAPAAFADGDAELDIVADALAREGVGRLYKRLVYDQPLANSVEAAQWGAGFSGVFFIVVTLRPDAALDQVRRIVADEIARLSREPLAPPELARVIASNEVSVMRQLETAAGRAEVLQGYNHYLGDPDRLRWDLDRYRTTTPDKIRATVATYLAPTRMITVVTQPAGGK